MISIIFAAVGAMACAFLMHVFVQFRRELRKEKCIEETRLTPVEIYRMEAAWEIARMTASARRRQLTPRKAA